MDVQMGCVLQNVFALGRGYASAVLVTALFALMPPSLAQTQPATGQKPVTTITLVDKSPTAGIPFRFYSGTRNKHDLPEIMGGGVAIFDADSDGLLDFYFCNGGPIDPGSTNPDPPSRLYRNIGHWKFEDITGTANAPGPSYAMGTAVGDFDGDHRPDLLVTGWGDQRLYKNLGNGRFEDVTKQAGLESKSWSTSAAFADLDGDGDQDLYVATYVDFDPKSAPFCAAPDGARDYCGPEDFQAQPDHLYRNNGNGTFTDVSQTAGITRPEGRGLGVLIAELTGDNRPDIYVANDSSPCWLFANKGNLEFDEIAEEAGVARDANGQVLSGMGIAAGDLDCDGLTDLVVTNFFGRSTVAFRAQGNPPGTFRDASSWLGLTTATRQVLGFGVILTDIDGDGRPDLLEANGHVQDRARLKTPFAMRPSLLHNLEFPLENTAPAAGTWLDNPTLGRGLAAADLDNDNRPDVVMTSLDAPPTLLKNEATTNHFVSLDLVDRHGRPAYGARVLITAGGRVQAAALASGGSYLCSAPPRLSFGLGAATTVSRIDILWPWGDKTSIRKPTIPQSGTIRIEQAQAAGR